MNNPNNVLDKLFAKTANGIKPGLDRIRLALNAIGNPQNSYSIVHVAGTNGKGSVCAYINSGLISAGFSVGVYSSPHIKYFEERFVINNHMAKTKDWFDVFSDIEFIINDFDLTFFEATTLISFELFKRKNVDWAVVETGLGGRLDATNIIIPEVSVITSIGIDHTEFLGNDILSIASEKLGIIKKNIPLVLANQENDDILNLAKRKCKEAGSELFVINKDSKTNNKLIFQDKEYFIKAKGEFQNLNVKCTLKSLELCGINLSSSIISDVVSTQLFGRFQQIRVDNKVVIFDVGHNPQAVQSFTKNIKDNFYGKSISIVVGIMADKDYMLMMKSYCSIAAKIVLTSPKTSRSAKTSDLIKAIPSNYNGDVIEIKSVVNAVSYALNDDSDICGISGSFYTVGESLSIKMLNEKFFNTSK